MRRSIVVAAVAASVGVTGGAITALGAGQALTPPVIHEKFTPLPCGDGQTTVEQQGCAEQQILRTDKKIDGVVADIFADLQDDPAKARLIKAQKVWLKFRQADCVSRSDIFEGGSQAAVIVAGCSADRNKIRLKELKQFRSDLVNER